jgi:hypothetical protein
MTGRPGIEGDMAFMMQIAALTADRDAAHDRRGAAAPRGRCPPAGRLRAPPPHRLPSPSGNTAAILDNPVVVGVTERALPFRRRRRGAALQLRCVGQSGGTYDDGRAEQARRRRGGGRVAARVPAGTPLVVVGYSFGAWVGTKAAQGPPRVQRVVAVAPPLAFFDREFAALAPPAAPHRESATATRRPRAAADRLIAQGIRRPSSPGADHSSACNAARVGRSVVELLLDCVTTRFRSSIRPRRTFGWIEQALAQGVRSSGLSGDRWAEE